MLVVVALGGDVLLRRGEPVDAEVHRDRAEGAARTLAAMAADHHSAEG